jgi:hypothetical protein
MTAPLVLLLALIGILAAAGMLALIDRKSRGSLPRESSMPDGRGVPVAPPTEGDAVGADLATDLRSIATWLAPLASSRGVTLEVGVPPNLHARFDPAALRVVVSEAVTLALAQAAGGRVLLTASRSDGQVRVAISDDGDPGSCPDRAGELRGARERMALAGGHLAVEVHPGEGTTVSLRLPAASPSSAGQAGSGATMLPAAPIPATSQ